MKQPHWILTKRWAEATFRKEAFAYWEHTYRDPQTGLSFRSEALDALNLQQIYNQYRTRHHIPFPAEIRQIREQYGLSAAKMAEILDLGTNTYRQYEHGEMPSLANAKLIRMAEKPQNFKQFVEEKKGELGERAYTKICQFIEQAQHRRGKKLTEPHLWNPYVMPNEFTGYVRPDLQKVAQFVMFFARYTQPLKTRLNKLLFYADFLHFRETGFAISGCSYRAIQLGPVPSHFHQLFGILEAQRFIHIEEELYDKGWVGERFREAQAFDPSFFSESELMSMKQVLDHFRDIKTQDLIAASHQEKGWIDNQDQRSLINYQVYAFDLRGV